MKQSFSHMARISYIIIIFYILISFITATPINNTSSISGNDPLQGDNIPHEDNSPHSDRLPRQLSGTNLHMAKFNLTVALEPNQSLRGQNITLNITFENKDSLRKFLTVQYIKIDLRPKFNVTRIYSKDKNDKSCQNRIRIPSFIAEKDKAQSFKYDIFISEDANLDIKTLIDRDEFIHKTEPLDIINIKKCRINITNSVHLKDDISILNNPPIIKFADVSINASQLTPMDNETLLIAENSSNSLKAMFNISAWDVEDGKSLRFNCLRTRNASSSDESEAILDDFAACGYFVHELEIQPGVKYSLWAITRDSNNEQSKIQANIIYGNNIYKYLLIPGEDLLDYSVLIITFIITIIMTAIIFHRIGYCSQKFLTRPRIVKWILITWLIYCILTWCINLIRLPFPGTYLFFNTMQLFELAMYITEFIIISSFIEACFFLEDLIDFHDNALWMNYISSLAILLIFIFIIPGVEGPLPLREYYATMSGLMGTIFVLVVTLSAQYPRNIFTSPIVKCSKSGGALNSADEVADEEDLFSYPKKLRYFVMLYGASLVISLIGLIIGTRIEFGDNFVNPLQGNPYNFLSVALFETTFLLIPPTVISLYHLMEVVSFRGKITIKSIPPEAMVFLSKMHEKRSSSVYRAVQSILDRFLAQDQEQACNIEPPHRLNLTTPCTLMLMRGTYNLKLKKDDMEKQPDPIIIRDAVESELTIHLEAKK